MMNVEMLMMTMTIRMTMIIITVEEHLPGEEGEELEVGK